MFSTRHIFGRMRLGLGEAAIMEPVPGTPTMERMAQFRDLLRRCLGGSEEAATELWRTYSPAARRAVRQNLPPALRCKCGSDDILQTIWYELFARVLEHCQPRSPQEMVGLVRRMARCQTVDLYRKYCNAGRHSIQRELSLESPAVQRLVEGMASKDLPPDEVVEMHEDLARIVEQAQTERECRIICMIRDGRTYNEVAAHLGISIRSVRRVILRVARRYRGQGGST